MKRNLSTARTQVRGFIAFTRVGAQIETVIIGVEPADRRGVGGGVRTLGHWNHNPALYQLSYTHRERGPFYRTKEGTRQQFARIEMPPV